MEIDVSADPSVPVPAAAGALGDRSAASRPGRPTRHAEKGPRRRGVLVAIGLMAPTLAAIAAVSLYPVGRTLWLSLRDTQLAQQQDKFTGLGNLRRMLDDDQVRAAWKQTVVFTAASTTLETLIGFGMALILFEAFRGRGLVRAAVLVPWAIPTVVTSRMFGWLFDGQNGVINYLLVKTHITGSYVNFLGSSRTAMWTIVVADVWKTTPFMALLILAGLQTVPGSLLEAARVDGASAWQAFWQIRLPLVMPSLLIAALLRSLDAFRVFDLPYTLTGGGPADSTETLSTVAYKRMFSGLETGYGSAIATATFVTEVFIAVGFGIFLARRLKATER
jgi:ABC-type sugar transport system permease subunit